MRPIFSLALLLPFVLLAACDRRPTGDDDAATDDDSTAGDDDDDDTGADDDTTPEPTPLPPEDACEDGADNDEDGLADCADPDCEDVFRCTWPVALTHTATLHFDANTLAEFAGYNDCDTMISSTMTELLGAGACDSCDRSFEGNYVYTADDCPQDPADPRPTFGSYGIDFVDAQTRNVYGRDENGAWNSIGTAFDAGATGTFTLTRTDAVVVKGIDAGELDTTLTFTDP